MRFARGSGTPAAEGYVRRYDAGIPLECKEGAPPVLPAREAICLQKAVITSVLLLDDLSK